LTGFLTVLILIKLEFGKIVGAVAALAGVVVANY